MHQAARGNCEAFGWTARLLDIADIPAHRANLGSRHTQHATTSVTTYSFRTHPPAPVPGTGTRYGYEDKNWIPTGPI